MHTLWGAFVPNVPYDVAEEVAFHLLPRTVVDAKGRARNVGNVAFCECDAPQIPEVKPVVIKVEKRAGSIASAVKKKGKRHGK